MKKKTEWKVEEDPSSSSSIQMCLAEQSISIFHKVNPNFSTFHHILMRMRDPQYKMRFNLNFRDT